MKGETMYRDLIHEIDESHESFELKVDASQALAWASYWDSLGMTGYAMAVPLHGLIRELSDIMGIHVTDCSIHVVNSLGHGPCIVFKLYTKGNYVHSFVHHIVEQVRNVYDGVILTSSPDLVTETITLCY